MENFSKFFDNIMSGKSNSQNEFDSPSVETNNSEPNNTALTNNDTTNIDNTNINNEIFPIDDYYLLANEVIAGAISLYNKLYNSLTVPYQFIAYYFQIFGRITSPRSNYLNSFIILFHNKFNNVSNAIIVFNKLYEHESKITQMKKSSIFEGLKDGHYLEVDKKFFKSPIIYSKRISEKFKTAVADARSFISEIEFMSKSPGFKSNFIKFLSLPQNINQVSLKVKSQQTSTRKKRLILPPKAEKETKVSSLSIPKIPLDSIYPTSLTHSRIDSAYYANAFLEGDRTYKLVKKYKFEFASYSDRFEVKRIALFESKKTSFDLF